MQHCQRTRGRRDLELAYEQGRGSETEEWKTGEKNSPPLSSLLLSIHLSRHCTGSSMPISPLFLTMGIYLVVQWLRLLAPNAAGLGSTPGWGTKIPCAMWYGLKINKIKMFLITAQEVLLVLSQFGK